MRAGTVGAMWTCGECGDAVEMGGPSAFLCFRPQHENSVRVTHGVCCEPDDPDAFECRGYHITVEELLRNGLDGPGGWRAHLSQKRWFDGVMSFRLEAIYNATVARRGR